MIKVLSVSATAMLMMASASQSSAQSGSTAIYADILGPSGSYALGVDQVVYRAGSSDLSIRLGGSYFREADVVGGLESAQIVAFPLAGAARVPLGRIASLPVSVEAEGGVSFARWWGGVTRFTTSPGESFRLFPHASAMVHVGLGRSIFARGGVTLGGVRGGGDVAPVAGVGISL